jgi:hypothetical protein
MSMNKKLLLITIAILLVLGYLFMYWKFGGWPIGAKLVSVHKTTYGPLLMALEHNVSDKAFEELVRGHPELINTPSNIDDPFTMPILVLSAKMKRTNYVRILIAHGADVEEGERWLDRYGPEEARQLLKMAKSEQMPNGK